jgi:DNA-binding transcriptional MerR regulator
MRIGDLARRSGLSAHTLRYYERVGLLPYADRDRGGRRNYDASILTWLAFLGRLKTTGMPIAQMRRYATLREQGQATGSERRVLLERWRERVAADVAELQTCLLVLDSKIAGYADDELRSQTHDQHAIRDAAKPARTRKSRARPN